MSFRCRLLVCLNFNGNEVDEVMARWDSFSCS
jgi:hypothetical protein